MNPATAALARMHDRVFAHFGEDAVLRASDAATVIVTENVELLGEYGQVAQLVTAATFSASLAPRPGDALALRGQNWVIDSILRGDSAVIECVIRKAAA